MQLIRFFVGICAMLGSILASVPLRAESPPLHLMVEDAASPFSERDGSGYANEVVTAAFNAIGVEIVLEVVPYARCKANVVKGLIAGCFSMSWESTFADHVRFSNTPLFRVTPTYFRNVRGRILVTRESQLGSGVNIGVVNGYEYPPSALSVQERGGIFHPARTEQTNLKKLAANRIDFALVMLNDLQDTEFLLDSAGVLGQVESVFSSTQLDSFIGFSTIHPRGIWALEKFNEGMRLIESNGKLKAILLKWSSKRDRPSSSVGG